jgi:hypothetical protein
MVLVVSIFSLTLLGVIIYFYVTRVFRKPNVPPAKVPAQDTILKTLNYRKQQSVIQLLSAQENLSHEPPPNRRTES